jgi:hypothetical protein
MGKQKTPTALSDRRPFVTREDLACPGGKRPYQERLDAAAAVDLRDNARVEVVRGSYCRVVPIDSTRRHKS